MSNLLHVFIVIACLLPSCSQKSSVNCDILIKNISIVNVEDGSLLTAQDVLISGDTIQGIFQTGQIAAISKNSLNGTGKYLIPGLWDMHVHIADSSFLNLFIRYGVTGVRDMGGNVQQCTNGCESLSPIKIKQWKYLIKANIIPGPEIYFSGPPLSGTGWPTSLPATSIKEMESSIDKLISLNVDFIKVYEKIPLDVYFEISKKAKSLKLDFAGHLPEDVLLSQASMAGQKSIEHIREVLLLCFAEDRYALEDFMSKDNYSAEDVKYVSKWIDDCDKAINEFKRNNTWITPTLTVEKSKIRYNDSAWVNDELRELLPTPIYMSFQLYLTEKRNLSKNEKKSEILWWETQIKLVEFLHKKGVGILAGTDAACQGGIPGFSLHNELSFLVDCGLSPLEALQTATLNPAKYFDRINSVKIIEKGRYADLVLLDKNPLINIESTKAISSVIAKGNLHSPIHPK